MADSERLQLWSLEESGQSTNDTRHRASAGLDDRSLGFSLPRADGGKEAWLFLGGCFFIEALTWGKRPETVHGVAFFFNQRIANHGPLRTH